MIKSDVLQAAGMLSPPAARYLSQNIALFHLRLELLVQGFTTGTIDRRGSGVIEVDTNFLHKKGLLVAKALVSPSDVTIPLHIANPYDESVTLNKHTLVATYEALDSEELISVNATQTVPNENIQALQMKSLSILKSSMQKALKILILIKKRSLSSFY